MKTVESSKYTAHSGSQVEVFFCKDTGLRFTIVNGEITLYGRDGDMVCGCRSVESAMRYIRGESL